MIAQMVVPVADQHIEDKAPEQLRQIALDVILGAIIRKQEARQSRTRPKPAISVCPRSRPGKSPSWSAKAD